MNNKYLMSRNQNVNFIRQHLDDYLDYFMILSKYEKDDPLYDKAYENFKNTYEFIMAEKDLPNDYHCLLKLHALLMDGLDDNINSTLTDDQLEHLNLMINQPTKSNTEVAIDVLLYILDKRLFSDGDVRSAIAFSNKILLDRGCGVIVILPRDKATFREKLKEFKDNKDTDFKQWVYKYCIKGKIYES